MKGIEINGGEWDEPDTSRAMYKIDSISSVVSMEGSGWVCHRWVRQAQQPTKQVKRLGDRKALVVISYLKNAYHAIRLAFFRRLAANSR